MTRRDRRLLLCFLAALGVLVGLNFAGYYALRQAAPADSHLECKQIRTGIGSPQTCEWKPND